MAALLRHPGFALCMSFSVLAVYALAGESALLALSAGIPLIVLLALHLWPGRLGLAVSDQVIERIDAVLRDKSEGPRQTGCFVVQFDDTSWLCDRHGRTLQSELLAACIGRIRGAMRPGDRLFPLEDGSLVVVLAPSQRLDLEGMVRIAGRMQLVVQQPITLGDTTAQVTCCIGFCHARQIASETGGALLEAAQLAADEAIRHRPGAIRAYSDALALTRKTRNSLRSEFAAAVAAGQIRAHFQPQISTDNGEVSGLEALARWHHPERGSISPGDFLPALEGTDLMELLGREMLAQSLSALAEWNRKGLAVPAVSVNLSPQELRDPQLPERLAWELDANGLEPGRLTIEVLESVVAGVNDDIIRRNLDRIALMGCGIDLDDFGTGNASITTIRHYSLQRLKIDRSFVRGVDCNRDQQKLVTAILAMAEQLGLEALAEGVETQAEHVMLSQLGCAHVQGYVIAKPMPREEVAGWLLRHREKQTRALQIELRAR
ncbi:MAG TPA: bifunctional diguanylate cyclase/phosphodiesterase [Tabrizicola sp.]|nr:bifunctional diguanylate cyclase/phosphodiesterase [Tabrizicola sp.]